MIGASKRIVCLRSPSADSAASFDKSQMMAFQSFDAVSKYRELRDQLWIVSERESTASLVREETYMTEIEQVEVQT